MADAAQEYDLVIIGGGINGAGIARDAAGRGLKTLLVEQNDLAGATSQWSTKLIHGGLRYLEHFEFRLVRESLVEREVLLRTAPHLVAPLLFVLPHEPHLRPAWMIRSGLFLYDRLGRRETLPASFATRLTAGKWGAGLKPQFTNGFVYADARVDDARLVVANAKAAAQLGADVRVRTRFTEALRNGERWRVRLAAAEGRVDATAKAIVNAAGPWVKVVRDAIVPSPARENVRLVKGSHIVVPRVHGGEHAYILQNADRRIVFVIPFEGRYSLIGTTDVAVEEFEHPQISADEIDYLLALANTYLAQPLLREDIVWSFAGVRPLYDDGSSDPSAITRDYVLKLDAATIEGTTSTSTPLLSIFGGKLTTYRRLAEHALSELQPFLPHMGGAWTARVPLPGGELPGQDFKAWSADLVRRHPALPAELVEGIAKRHGSLATKVLGDARIATDLGEHFGNGLTAAEIDYLLRNEWAKSADDVLWRRTKCGLGMSQSVQDRVAAYIARMLASSSAVPRS